MLMVGPIGLRPNPVPARDPRALSHETTHENRLPFPLNPNAEPMYRQGDVVWRLSMIPNDSTLAERQLCGTMRGEPS